MEALKLFVAVIIAGVLSLVAAWSIFTVWMYVNLLAAIITALVVIFILCYGMTKLP